MVLRNLRRVAALETIGGAIFFITKLMIAATCALVCYIWLGQAFTEETHSIVYPTLLVGLLAYNLGDIFVRRERYAAAPVALQSQRGLVEPRLHAWYEAPREAHY